MFLAYKIAYFRRIAYFCIMNKKTIYENLSSAEKGDSTAQSILCQFFYDNKELCKSLPDDFWERIESIAQKGEDFANFIMHCRFFDDATQCKLSYDYIRKAIRHKKIPIAILRLGITYAQGIGTTENHVLANYFYEMALGMGCQEAERLIKQEFESGERDIISAIERALGHNAIPSPQRMDRYKEWIDGERRKKNYGYLAKIREYLPIFYPDYNEEKAFEDILNNRDTIDADICYSLSTSDNLSEFNLDILESMLRQLFLPITEDEDLLNGILETGNINLLQKEDVELLQCIVNLTSSYDNLCEKHNIEKKELADINPLEMYPYINVTLLGHLRKQAFRCLLSLRGIDTELMDRYLRNLLSDEDLLHICEVPKDQDLQLFLISFVELNIDIDILEVNYQSLLHLYKDHNLNCLANLLNDFVSRLNDAGIEHKLPEFTTENLPPIELS